MDKTTTMDEHQALDICREIELLNEQLYRHFTVLFADDPELGELWKKTANEEANHAQQFELAVRTKKEMGVKVVVDAQELASAHRFISSILEVARNDPPTAADALHLGVKLEERLAGLHMGCVALFRDESHRALFRAMMANDNRHLDSLMEARDKYSRSVH